eukprot:TRINITY_DN43_c0_g1_i1.p1 TRINITY_DN43_c0_g1~~TRINITY_DN43_c0_g1_i1.p1  ORF type:complete len:435 (+),score=142.67 TRINITY_DN43_c0_g1_i1:113-1417(+)
MVKRVGNYELGRTLGRGTFSKVKVGVDVRTQKTWAIKIVDRSEVVKEHMEAQLKREIAIMKMVHHKNIVNLREVLQTQRNIYIVLELVTGGELFDRIVQAKRFDEDTARMFFQQLIVGVDYCHRNGIAHRDLKPENLLLDGDTLKISDFGLSSLTGEGRDVLTTTCGTPNYVAPEVLAEKGYDGMRADIWSCGVILFVMLAGFLPFDDPTLSGLFSKIEKGDYRVPRFFSSEVGDLVRRMLVLNPAKRISIDKIKSHPWFKKGFKEVEESLIAMEDVEATSAISKTTETETEGSEVAKIEEKEKPAFTAFDLAARLMAGSLEPLLAKGQIPPRKYTSFMASGAAAMVMERIVAEMTKMGANPKNKSDELLIKCSKPFSRGLLTFTVTILPTISETLSLIEFRRSRGDALEFNQVFRDAMELLSDIATKSGKKTA